jgi:outer membrane protein OmpA-like peptidoglycan-associated protein
MSRARPIGVLVGIGGLLTASCAAKRAPQPAPAKPALIALLPDPETGTTGRAVVTNEFGSADLTSPRDAVQARSDRRPGPVVTIDESEVARLFDSALSALPPAPRRFTLFFSFESDELTEESRALVPEILKAVKAFPHPEVAVVGHTDTMGDVEANVALGLKRAVSIQRLLVDAGMGAALIEVSSHGEADLLVKTPDNTPEPRNRRVEIVLR